MEHHRLHRILHEHHLREDARTTGHRRHIARNVATGVDIHTARNVIYASSPRPSPTVRRRRSVRGTHIDDGAFRLQPLALDLHGTSLRRNDVVGLPLTLRTNAYILQQTGRDIGVTVRELASHVLVTQQQRNRKTDVVAATNHRRLLLF